MENCVQVGEVFSVQNVAQKNKSLRTCWEMTRFLLDGGNYPREQAARIARDAEQPFDEIDESTFDLLSDSMASLAPAGTYFGENPHDEGMFGFWPVPDNFSEVHS